MTFKSKGFSKRFFLSIWNRIFTGGKKGEKKEIRARVNCQSLTPHRHKVEVMAFRNVPSLHPPFEAFFLSHSFSISPAAKNDF